MKHYNNITIINNHQGTPADTSGVMGLVCHATAVSTTFALDTAYLLTKIADLDTLGITESNNEALYQHVTEFYGQTGDGLKLWIYGVADTTAYATWLASADKDFQSFVKGTYLADNDNGVKGVALAYKVPTATQSSADFPTDVLACIDDFQDVIDELFLECYPLFGIVDGNNMDSRIWNTNSVATLGTLTGLDCHSVGLCITGTLGNGISSVGLLLGKLALISVGTSIGKVADGSIDADSMFLTNGIKLDAGDTMTQSVVYTVRRAPVTYNGTTYAIGDTITCLASPVVFTTDTNGYLTTKSTPVNLLTGGDNGEFNDLGGKNYIFTRTWQGFSGFYWNDGSTCDLSTKPFSTIEYNRIANKLSADALYFWTSELNKNLPVDGSGNADGGYLGNKCAQYFNTYINPLILSGDISNGKMIATGLNFVTEKTINYEIQILPAPAISSVIGTITFVTTL